MKMFFKKGLALIFALSLSFSGIYARPSSDSGDSIFSSLFDTSSSERSSSRKSTRSRKARNSRSHSRSRSSSKNSRSSNDSSSNSSRSENSSSTSKYNGDIQFNFGIESGKLKSEIKSSSYGYSTSKDYELGSKNFSFGIANHNAFKIKDFGSYVLSVGFMETMNFAGGHTEDDYHNFNFSMVLAPLVSLKVKDIVKVQVGMGLGILSTEIDGEDVGSGAGFAMDMQGKFFPQKRFSPLVGLAFISGVKTDDDIKLSKFDFYFGGGWNLGSR